MTKMSTLKRRENEFFMLELLYEHFEVGVEKQSSAGEMAQTMGFSASQFSQAFDGWRECDIVTLRRAYVANDSGVGPGSYIRSYFTVLVPKAQALAAFTRYWDRLEARRNSSTPPPLERPEPIAPERAPLIRHKKEDSPVKPGVPIVAIAIPISEIPAPSRRTPDFVSRSEAKRVAIQTEGRLAETVNHYRDTGAMSVATTNDAVVIASNPVETTRAIAGPESEAGLSALRSIRRSDDAEAAINAARQYGNRNHAVEAKIAELEKLGVTVDREQLLGAIKMPQDPFLEAISKVVPVVDRLEAAVTRLAEQNLELRRKVTGYDQLRREFEQGKRLNERLIAERGAPAAASTRGN